MIRKAIVFVGMFVATLGLYAQIDGHIDEMYINARGSFNVQHAENTDKGFEGENLNFVIAGKISDNLSYRIRQRFNKAISASNPFNATDFLYLDWKANDHWTFSFGKQEIYIGGFEYDYAPIDVYFWSECWGEFPSSYSFAASAAYNFTDKQKIILQLSNSPFYSGSTNNLSYNLVWFGEIFPFWKTIWSVNESEYSKGNFQNIISLGNRFEFSSFYWELDFVNRAISEDNGTEKDDFFLSHWGVVTKLNYRCDKWNLFCKFSYDKDNNFYLDRYIKWSDHNYTTVGVGAEFFPLNDDRLRLHAVYYANNIDQVGNTETRHNVLFGATWKINLKK
jgi:hypothetical protein